MHCALRGRHALAAALSIGLYACGGATPVDPVGDAPPTSPPPVAQPRPFPGEVDEAALVDLERYGLADEMPPELVIPVQSAQSASVVAAQRPNIVVVMTDDQAMRDLAAMPWTMKLMRDQGVAFANSFASWPLCCPSRTTAFTGQYAHNHRVLGNYAPEGGAQAFADAESLPVWLQRAGYRTVHIGKYLNEYGMDARGSTYVPAGWTEWRGLVDWSTYQMWGYTMSRDGVLETHGRIDDQDPALYQTDVIAELALDAIRRNAASGAPFFLSVAFLAPHEEVPEASPMAQHVGPRPAPRHNGFFGWVPLPKPLSFDEADLSDKPEIVRTLVRAGKSQTLTQRTTRYRRRLESLKAVDEALRRILIQLNQLGILDGTVVVFTSDNGYFNGEHGLVAGKNLMYEPSIRVPLLVRGRGIAPGTSHELVANVDLAPTFLELAGAQASGRVVDGRSLLPYARDVTLRSSRPILLDATISQPLAASLRIPAMQGLRTKRYSYVGYDTGDVELYDLLLDPGQLQSVHADPAYAGVRAMLAEAVSRYSGCTGETCRAPLTGVQ